MKKISKKAKRRLIVLTISISGVCLLLICSVFKDWKQILENRKTTNELEVQYEALLKGEEQLNSEVNKLKDPEYVARYAREKFLYSLPDEIIIRKSK